jgi:hypothetical protein
MTKYYVIEVTDTAFNPQDAELFSTQSRPFAKIVEISTIPAIYNSSKEECLQGWCGTTQGLCVDAHGVFETLEAAQDFVEKKFPEMSDTNEVGEEFESDYENVVAVYRSF